MDLFGKKELMKIREDLSSVHGRMKDQFQEHLDSINDNTNEIQANYEYLVQLDNKIEKLAQRIDQMQLFLRQLTNHDSFVYGLDESYKIQPLSMQEREIFLVLYAASNDSLLSYKNIADKLNQTESLAKQYVTNLIEKGIPVIKEYKLGRPYLRIDKKFKELQAKQNILNIDEELLKKLLLRP